MKKNIPWKTRLIFGTIDELNQTIINQSMMNHHRDNLKDFNPMKFNMLRYFKHTTEGNDMKYKKGKPIVDVSRMPIQRFNNKINYPYSPLSECSNSEHNNNYHY